MISQLAGAKAGAVTTRKQRYWWREELEESPANCAAARHPGDPCPFCGEGRLDFDTLFLLSCPLCGRTAAGGAFT